MTLLYDISVTYFVRLHREGEMTQTKLLDQVRNRIRRLNYAYSTEKTYTSWIRRYILFHDKRHPRDMGEAEIEAYLTHLAVNQKVAPSTQNQALAALQFLYQEVLRVELNEEILPVPAKRPKHLPVVLSRGEVRVVLEELSGIHLLICQLLYGCGLRVTECLSLRIQDLDFDRREITVRSGKGGKDRRTVLPDTALKSLRRHIKKVRLAHEEALEEGYGTVALPRGLARKYPAAASEWGWQYLFPAPNPSTDPRSGAYRRHHLHPSGLRRAVREAARKADLTKHVTPHTFRHSFATHLLESGEELVVIQALLGHSTIKTTTTYTHVRTDHIRKVTSPFDFLPPPAPS